MTRSGSQSPPDVARRLIRENTNQWYSICADLVNTRKNAGFAGIQSSARPKAATIRRPRTRLPWRTPIGNDVIQDMDGSTKSFSSVTQAICSKIALVDLHTYWTCRDAPARRPQQQARGFFCGHSRPGLNGPPRAPLRSATIALFLRRLGLCVGVATDSAATLATDCWRASSFSASVAICLESFFVSACWAPSGLERFAVG